MAPFLAFFLHFHIDHLPTPHLTFSTYPPDFNDAKMVKRDPIKDDSDTYDDTDVDMKSPTKKRKVAGKKEEPVDSSPDVKKRGKGASV